MSNLDFTIECAKNHLDYLARESLKPGGSILDEKLGTQAEKILILEGKVPTLALIKHTIDKSLERALKLEIEIKSSNLKKAQWELEKAQEQLEVFTSKKY